MLVRRRLLAAALAALSLLFAAAAQAAPLVPALQLVGVLQAAGGGPVADGKYSLEVRLWDGPGATAKQLYHEAFLAVQVGQGRFDLVLGTGLSQKPLTTQLFQDAAEVWLAIAVAGEPELPRVRLQPVAFALRAAVADSAVTAQTAEEAQAAVVANLAKGLACTGCVTGGMIAPEALAASGHPASYGGQQTHVQAALDGLHGRLAGLETGLKALDGKVGIGTAAPQCAIDLGGVCQGALPGRIVVTVADAKGLQGVPTGDTGVVVYRKDDGLYYGHTPLGWRSFRFNPICGDGAQEAEEECDDGKDNADAPDKCRTTCKKPACGDGIQDAAELCDDGNGVTTDACVPGCKKAACGDGWLQAGVEACDDGNQSDTDACTAACTVAKCGDGKVQAGVEECDDGNQIDADDCSNACKNTVKIDTAFGTCGASGPGGPSQSQCNGAYGPGHPLNGQVTVKNGVQTWTVPASGSYRISAFGGQGGTHPQTWPGGKGARMVGTFDLVKGQVLYVVVGHQGAPSTSGNDANGGAGGGGGSFVWLEGAAQPLLAAGAGGGSCLKNSGQAACTGKPGVTTIDGSPAPSGSNQGTNGGDSSCPNGGRGWNTVKTNPVGTDTSGYNAGGGFGGGSGGGQNCGGNYGHVAGGGGGYSGGGGGTESYLYAGGGGGSYNAGKDQDNASGVQAGHGVVAIKKL